MIRIYRKNKADPVAMLGLVIVPVLMILLLAGCGAVGAEVESVEDAAAPVEESAPPANEVGKAFMIGFSDMATGGMDEYPTTADECICGEEALEMLERLNEERARKGATEE